VLEDVLEVLKHYSVEEKVTEAAELIEYLSSQTGDSITVGQEKRFFGYTVMGLIGNGKRESILQGLRKNLRSREAPACIGGTWGNTVLSECQPEETPKKAFRENEKITSFRREEV
jgi:hypothetical protein